MGTLLINIPFIQRLKEGAPDKIPMRLDFPIQRVGATQVLEERYFE
jgi:hypothetical protein